MKRAWALAIAAVLLLTTALAGAAPLRVGSKRFTESYVLAEIIVALAKSEGIDVVHDQGLGGTAVTFRALEDGSIDLYPDYTGTVDETVVHGGASDVDRLRDALRPKGIGLSDELGFENTYALALAPAAAKTTGIHRISELGAHPELRMVFSHEFLGRTDGWPALAARYGLNGGNAKAPTAIDHALAYEALAKGSADLTDVYTTDAKIDRYHLSVLEDDRRFFPRYAALFVYRLDARTRWPALDRVLSRVRGSIDVATMQRLNARAELDAVPFSRVAAEHLGASQAWSGRPGLAAGVVAAIVRHGPRHLELVFGALLLSTIVGVPLGAIAFARRRAGSVILGVSGVVQTIPSLALFCFFIPLLGIGPVPALAALFLYGLLPIVRNTHAGLASVGADLREAADAIGLSPWERLVRVELPLAARTILAGIKTSAVVGVGSATIAAFIGAGGFGEPISTGLSLNDVSTILEGAIPAAGLALLVQGAFALVEKAVVPRGLREP